MAETRRYGVGAQLDIEQILLEAQNRWLRPAEICEILRNYGRFNITQEPPHRPSSGSLFLFDRKVLRYFRKDGHNWRKKKDGKTVKEAHERLKAGSIDVLHCYYAHGEESENFQRRSYWMLEEDLSHIVLVHYREVKGNRTNFNRSSETEEAFLNSQEPEDPNLESDSSASSRFQSNGFQAPSQTTDTASLSAQASEYEDAESAYSHQASSRYPTFVELPQSVMEKTNPGFIASHYPVSFSNDYEGKLSGIPLGTFSSFAQGENRKNTNDATLAYELHKRLDMPWKDMLENCTAGIRSVPFQSSTKNDTIESIPEPVKEISRQLFMDGLAKKQEFSSYSPSEVEWQVSSGSEFTRSSIWPADHKCFSVSTTDFTTIENRQEINNDLYEADPDEQIEHHMQNNHMRVEGKHSATQHLLDHSLVLTGLNKNDSFNRWMSKELGDVDGSHIQSSSETYWDTVGSENGVDPSISPREHLESYTLPPSLAQDQLFSIIDFSPSWGYVNCETKILIMGKFLKNQSETVTDKWSCMFGEVEVPAEVVTDGVLRCHTPLSKAGRVPFYVTCSNRLACSEVREFEFRGSHSEDVDLTDVQNESLELLQMRLGKLLTLSSVSVPAALSCSVVENDTTDLGTKISSLLKGNDNDEWNEMLMLTSKDAYSMCEVKDKLLQKILKEHLYVWLLQKVTEGGKGPSILDEGGQGVLHLAAALGYDWAIEATVISGVSVNFRDANGWTALHWAASWGRESTVVSLITLGAAPGPLTDPTPIYPEGKTPADLASAKGHKGIAGYLAESALSAHLSSLKLETNKGDSVESPGTKAVAKGSEQTITPIGNGGMPHEQSFKDSLAAVCNAEQAAARIHQAFRVESFRRKQLMEYGDDRFGLSDEHALSRIALKTHKSGHDVPVHAAAVRIQNKFRSWKGRRDFLFIRQRIVKIQAHVRGHQVRKNYKPIVWSVGILEKVILRWRRRGCGLRGFKPEALADPPKREVMSTTEDDYDFLKEGRKQTEHRLEKALARVKSMVQYPEARDQYRRLRTVVTGIQEAKDIILDDVNETVDYDNDLIDLRTLLEDDTFMQTAL